MREIARVLRPGGILAILFNQIDGDLEPPLPEAFWDAYRAVAIEKPPEHTVSSGLWRAPFPGPFEPFTEAAIRILSSSTARGSSRRSRPGA